jgi:ABC-type nickel/cobalt efflux system permease component RcnA
VANRNSLTGRIRVVGLVSSVIAVVALGLTVLAGNRNLGRNETITQRQQIFLLLAAAVLFVVRTALYLIFRHRQRRSCRETTASSKRTEVKE